MKSGETSITEMESWEIIQNMIQQAKNEVRDNDFFYLLWGWLVLIASLGHYVLGYIVHYPRAYMVWLLMLVGIGGTIYEIAKINKKERVKTYIDRFIGNFWLAIFISIMIALIGGGFKLGFQAVYPFVITLYGIGTFVSGSIFRFKPLQIGGVLCWIIALVAFFVSFPNQLLLLALTTLVSYLIPGYMLKTNHYDRV